MKESHIKPLIPLIREAITVIPEVGADNPWLKNILGVTFLSGI